MPRYQVSVYRTIGPLVSVAEWTKRNLLGFVYNVYIELISYSDFYLWLLMIFKNLGKMKFLKIAKKICRLKGYRSYGCMPLI